MPKVPELLAPKLTNRGAAGLLTKLPAGAEKLKESIVTHKIDRSVINKIHPDLEALIVDIDSLTPDPDNARLHPERNMEAIMDSLALYGQTTAIVARKSNRVVLAGNGRLEAAKKLGWTKIAVSFVDMDDAMAAGYGLADNRTAELAAWNMEVVHRLDALYQAEEGFGAVGWSLDELVALRTDWSTFTGTLEVDLPQDLEEQEVDQAPGDAELLMKLKVTIEEPRSQVKRGEIYLFSGRHMMVIADVVSDADLWLPHMTAEKLFCPYPGPLLLLTQGADPGDKENVGLEMLLVQPDYYIAGHILDNYKAIHGEDSVTILEPESQVV